MKASPLVFVFCLASTPAWAAVPTPADFGKLFCEASLADDMSIIEDKLTPGLGLVVAEAVAKNTQAEVSFPDEKPPLGDGLPWRSYQDFADGCELGEILKGKTDDQTLVEIRYSFKDYPDANYTDRLVLVPSITEPGSWELDDIKLVDDGTMRSYLAEAFQPAPTN